MNEKATIGFEYTEDSHEPRIGSDSTIRSGTIIYNDVVIGDHFSTGHYALVRELTEIGDNVLIGTNTVIDGRSVIGSNVSLQTGVYIPSNTTIGSQVFIGPHAVLTNDQYPVRQDTELSGPTIEDHVSIGANSTILPNVTIGEGSFVAAGSVVVDDVPPQTLAVGIPAEHRSLPKNLQGGNDI
ncbi:acyltransferase [Natronosalvus halobius]|uniref:acyltransferase n=1 Tax=Natronosalvus halobius TaxID=2953746 RepID=UPI0020A154D8|nr:DapH/DapD/GlmU-related protein [Natronosalvus halobius]USZ71476.1 N-acetyltransferase [Natronosalvus halobius]